MSTHLISPSSNLVEELLCASSMLGLVLDLFLLLGPGLTCKHPEKGSRSHPTLSLSSPVPWTGTMTRVLKK